jgi:transcriptional regulator with XRE-family HTH domain
LITHYSGLAALSEERKPQFKVLLTADKPQMSHLIRVDIGDRIRAARAKAGLTQRALAALLGVDKSAVAQWEGGGSGRGGIKTSNLVEVARVLGIRPSELLGEPTQADKLVLEDTDEITLVMLYRGLPKRQRDIYRELLKVGTDLSHFPERDSHEIERRGIIS